MLRSARRATRWMQEKPKFALDEGVAVRMMRDVAEGVAYLHRERVSRLHQLWRLRSSGRGQKRQGAQEVGQVVHRDIKTGNILVDMDSEKRLTLKLTDFGCAKIKANWRKLTATVGTPNYMAPEVMEEGVSPVQLSGARCVPTVG
jgi:serine/threonine protein kinase